MQKKTSFFILLLVPLLLVVHAQHYPSTLSFLYQSPVGNSLRYAFVQPWFSRLAGWYYDLPISKIHIASFVKKHNIALHESLMPSSSFTSFNDFFIRKLKPEARPIDFHPRALIAPCDGKLTLIENIQPTTTFPIKEMSFNLAEFVQSNKRAQKYYGGTLLLFRLDPWDYHRFHFPIDCVPLHPKKIHGSYESVNPIAYIHGIQSLCTNERHVLTLKSHLFDDITTVCVGALCVGKITQTHTPYKRHAKGDEMGYFSYGGSTLVLLCKPDTLIIPENLQHHTELANEIPIKMGTVIGYSKKSRP